MFKSKKSQKLLTQLPTISFLHFRFDINLSLCDHRVNCTVIQDFDFLKPIQFMPRDYYVIGHSENNIMPDQKRRKI